ncbi:hypothetical protein [Neobacillus cucumis]|uniref:hypothetical protein n=1 Tax=Neobacillus cucumis TaxID=1740721 RepID=UPI002E240667|nr:hypothetical protein [Neobacillus cucumis]
MVERVRAASAQIPSNRLIIAPGCALPNDIPEFHFNILKEAMDLVFGTVNQDKKVEIL